MNDSDYWTDEEWREWDNAMAEANRRNPAPLLRRSSRPVRKGRLIADQRDHGIRYAPTQATPQEREGRG